MKEIVMIKIQHHGSHSQKQHSLQIYLPVSICHFPLSMHCVGFPFSIEDISKERTSELKVSC